MAARPGLDLRGVAALCAAVLAGLAGALVLMEDHAPVACPAGEACDAGTAAATSSVNVAGVGLVAAAIVLAAVGLLLLRRQPSPGDPA